MTTESIHPWPFDAGYTARRLREGAEEEKSRIARLEKELTKRRDNLADIERALAVEEEKWKVVEDTVFLDDHPTYTHLDEDPAK